VRSSIDGEQTLRWGLLAPWRGHGGKRAANIVCARPEDIAPTPVLRNARRCVILADGFFAWRRIGKKLQPYWIHGPSAGFAGVAAVHADDGVWSFAMLVGDANALVAPIAREMPLVAGEAWLATGEIDTWSGAGWRADAVSTWVNDLAHDDPRCVQPLGNPAQGELF
jgi:putative SOS response-associated peptidase YedK